MQIFCTFSIFFIKGKQENVPPQQRSIKDRLGIPSVVPPNSNKVLNLVQQSKTGGGSGGGGGDNNNTPDQPQSIGEDNVENAEKPLNNNSFTKNNMKKEGTKAMEVAAIKKTQEMLAVKEKLKKNQEENRKEALKLTQNLRKRKQELLEKQVAHQKLLLEKLEKSK